MFEWKMLEPCRNFLEQKKRKAQALTQPNLQNGRKTRDLFRDTKRVFVEDPVVDIPYMKNSCPTMFTSASEKNHSHVTS